MRRAEFEADEAEAWRMFEGAASVRFAGLADGRPVLRTLSAVVLDGAICVHGGDDGEKLGLLGPVMASCDEVIAQVPSYWIHPELACPASTYYLSAVAEGQLVRVEELARKAAIMEALMQRFQPEGGYVPLDDVRYRKVLAGLMVAELRPVRLSAKRKLGQHRSKRQIETVLEGLWRRGACTDLRAIELIRAAHPAQPVFREGPEQSVLHVLPSEADAREVAALLEGEYWTGGLTLDQLARAQRGSEAWIVARGPEGVRASARAVSDGARLAYVMDVVVQEQSRGRGYGRALMQLLLDHPRVRGCARVGLRTRTPAYYEPLGFRAVEHAGEMLLSR
jgi:N-acetylglutamate synthase-like GNAT family acetyltransferase/nitroimidazol reductase NimA-like FMN-containing flavoprotein (pyridoxamine 5'-phosphate oxidase superfamily)